MAAIIQRDILQKSAHIQRCVPGKNSTHNPFDGNIHYEDSLVTENPELSCFSSFVAYVQKSVHVFLKLRVIILKNWKLQFFKSAAPSPVLACKTNELTLTYAYS